MLANSIVRAMSTGEAMNYGIVIVTALILVCDIWFVLFHQPREHE